MNFSTNDLYFNDSDKKEYVDAINVLNSLTEEQKKAARLYGSSRYSEGEFDGYRSGYNENSE